MPPQQRARKTAAPEPAVEDEPSVETAAQPEVPSPDPDAQQQPEPGPICGACFPGGWDALPAGTATAGCEHGAYTR